MYDDLFGETMCLYAGRGRQWYTAGKRRPGWAELRRQHLAALGYHSPNLLMAQRHQLELEATASDQEPIATLILSGRYVGFLPDHYAEPFVHSGRMRAVASDTLVYRCRFSCIHRRTPAPLRLAEGFRAALLQAHASSASS